MIFIAENSSGNILGVAILLHELTINFFYLDYIAVKHGRGGTGIGSALYQKIRDEAIDFEVLGIFFDCYTDNPLHYQDKKLLLENQKRLKFYEEFGALPIINTKYEETLDENSYPSFLLYDSLDRNKSLNSDIMRVIVKVILERRYGNICPISYIEKIIASFNDEPVKLREYKYLKKKKKGNLHSIIDPLKSQKIIIVMNEQQKYHNISTRGYYEVPVRVKKIWDELNKTSLFHSITSKEFPRDVLLSVHNADYVDYMEEISKKIKPKQRIYPIVFPVRNLARPPTELIDRVGYYCMDTTTPLIYNIFKIARRAVECTLTAADFIIKSKSIAYSLIRPPGHHAESNLFGGYCYFNSTAIAAEYLSKLGKVCVLDIDYHHGNGTQEIFYKRKDILTISIHGDPEFEYPFFTGFADECGEDEGKGFNINIPLPKGINGDLYMRELKKVINKIHDFQPTYLVIALGFDTARKDPTGTWKLNPEDFHEIGKLIGKIKVPALIVQEGGYLINSIGKNATNFFNGLWYGFYQEN